MATQPRQIEPDDILEMDIPAHLSGYELVDGKLVPVRPASPIHGWLMIKLGQQLLNHIEAHELGGRVITDAGFVLPLARDPRRLRGPDIAYLTAAQIEEHGEPGEHFARFMPVLAVEIDLKSRKKPGGQERIRDYLEARIPLIWAIDPHKRTATVYRQDGSITQLSETDSLDGETAVPGFTLPLSTLFR